MFRMCVRYQPAWTRDRRACRKLHRDLAVGGAGGDFTRSGTTLCAALITGRRLTVANVGDSGCVRISRQRGETSRGTSSGGSAGAGRVDASASGSRRWLGRGLFGTGKESGGGNAAVRLAVERLSRDHKPELDDELRRITVAGGVVFPLPSKSSAADGLPGGSGWLGLRKGQTGPGKGQHVMASRDFGAEVPRVWRPDGNGPGLAMSRSIGDKVGNSWCPWSHVSWATEEKSIDESEITR